jgi:hypothetical protein
MFDRRQQDELWAARIMCSLIITKRRTGHKAAAAIAGGRVLIVLADGKTPPKPQSWLANLHRHPEFNSTCKARPKGLEC